MDNLNNKLQFLLLISLFSKISKINVSDVLKENFASFLGNIISLIDASSFIDRLILFDNKKRMVFIPAQISSPLETQAV